LIIFTNSGRYLTIHSLFFIFKFIIHSLLFFSLKNSLFYSTEFLSELISIIKSFKINFVHHKIKYTPTKVHKNTKNQIPTQKNKYTNMYNTEWNELYDQTLVDLSLSCHMLFWICSGRLVGTITHSFIHLRCVYPFWCN
jgi:hypothetical protein